MPRVIEDSSKYETWESATDAKLWVKRFGRNGELVDEAVNGRRKLLIRPEERRLNQEIAAEDSMDFFKNGMLMPVDLIETSEDIEELKSYPNHLSESEMVELLQNRKAVKAFNDRVARIDNPITLKKFIEIAESEAIDATTRQVRVLEDRLEEVDPSMVNEISSQKLQGPEARADKSVLRAPQER